MKAKGDPDLSSQTLPVHSKRFAISTAPEVYTQSNGYANGGLRLCVQPFGACRCRIPGGRAADNKEMWPFFGHFFALPI